MIDHASAIDIPISSLAMTILFGVITFATADLATRIWIVGDHRSVFKAVNSRARLLDTESFISIFTLLYHSTIFGFILLFAYICENHPPFPHGDKTYDRDQFIFLIALVVVTSFYTVKKNEATSSLFRYENDGTITFDPDEESINDERKTSSVSKSHISSIEDQPHALSTTHPNSNSISDPDKKIDVLNRCQTQEWKGWMQLIFLFYHYYHAEEMYNAIRIMITCYIWMTGFGNFTFFYNTGDLSFVRVINMMWRLNFLALFLMMSQGTTYIHYYIVPLHTFFFLIVHGIFSVWRNLNYSKLGLRFKLAFSSLVAYAMWDLDLGIFQLCHGPFLSSKPTLGAIHGSLWEWYFRTTLDHWSVFLGMIFAADLPITSSYIQKLEALPAWKCWIGKGLIGLCLLMSFCWWLWGPFQLEKYQYNLTNPYFGFLPLMTYIYFRNLTPRLRAYHLKLFHEIGNITLETYLMQHHIWLSSNGKTVLVFIRGYPKFNMLIVTGIYFTLSRYLHQLTLFLRDMVIPKNTKGCIRSLTILVIFITTCFVAAYGIKMNESYAFATFCVISVFGLILAKIIWAKVSPVASKKNTFIEGNIYVRSIPALVAMIFISIIGSLWMGFAIFGASKIGPLTSDCGRFLNQGRWISVKDSCYEDSIGSIYRDEGIMKYGKCSYLGSTSTWGWDVTQSPKKCRFGKRSEKDLQDKLYGKRVLFVGDSITRFLYHAFCRSMGMIDAGIYDSSAPKHSDIARVIDNTALHFKWAPFASDQVLITKDLNEKILTNSSSEYDLIVIGGGPWDRLWKFESPTDKENTLAFLADLRTEVEGLMKFHVPVVWVTPTTINNSALNTPEKRDHMKEENIEEIRKIHEEIGFYDIVSFVIDGPSFSRQKVNESLDGVHYPPEVYDVGGLILANALDWLIPPGSAEHITSPDPSIMANPYLGLMMLGFCAIGIFYYDGFLGVFFIPSLIINGIRPSYLYLEAFNDLREQNRSPTISSSSGTSYCSDMAKVGNNSNQNQIGSPTAVEGPRRRSPIVYCEEAIDLLENESNSSGSR